MSSLFDIALHDLAGGQVSATDAARSIYSQLTLDEKLFLLDGDLTPMQVINQFRHMPYNSLPYHAGTIDRVGLPGIRFSDGPSGCSLGKSTAFPVPSARAGSWDAALEEEVGEAIGAEIRAQGGNFYGGVCVNLAPHPAWGRSQESYGEDPLLIGTMGAALSKGTSKHTMPCVKHFALNSMENMRFKVDVQVTEDILHEVYLPHFKQVLDEGRADSIMSCYNTINGIQGGDNPNMLNGIVRDNWKRDDVFIVSDFIWGMRDAAESVKAGLDVEMMFRNIRAAELPKAVQAGRVTEEDIERLGVRLIAAQLRYYQRIKGTACPSTDVVLSDDHFALARRTAAAGMVLLQNGTRASPVLPLGRDRVKRLGVFGELANSTQTGDDGSSKVHTPNVLTPIEAIRAAAGTATEVIYHDGKDTRSAVALAGTCDAVFVLVGMTSKDEGESLFCTDMEVNRICLPAWGKTWISRRALQVFGRFFASSGGDREDLRLRGRDLILAESLAPVVGSKMILAVEAGSTVCLPQKVLEGTGAILYTGYGGCQFGHALNDVLWGHAEPAGRLPYVIPKDEIQDLPVWNRWADKVTYDRWWGYRMINRDGKKAAFPFGFGLGYGSFELVQGSLIAPGDFNDRFFEIEAEVENTSQVTSSVVLQIYGGKVAGSLTGKDYTNVLLGFTKMEVQPGRTARINVACRLNPLARYLTHSASWKVEKADYEIRAGLFEGDEKSLSKRVRVDTPVEWSS